MKNLLYLFIFGFLFTACQQNANTEANDTDAVDSASIELQAKAAKMFAPVPEQAESAENPLTAEKIALGNILYFDTRLSMDGTQSCNTCHNLSTFGVDNQPTSKGDDGSLGTRNSPTSIHAALQFVQFWDGRSPHVEDQAGGPVLNPVEMGMPDSASVEKRLAEVEGYQKLFAKAFPEDENPISYVNMTLAIGAFERTLMPTSPFDEYLKGNMEALSAEEQDGLKLFMDKGCTTCHNGVGIGGGMYQKFALFGNYWDYTHSAVIDSGRYVVTGNEADLFVFKTPLLRNITETGPYFHDGSISELSEAVKIMGKTELNIDLSDEETQSIVAFLGSLKAPLTEEQTTAPAMPE
jgi:cytochrome c peroxidase